MFTVKQLREANGGLSNLTDVEIAEWAYKNRGYERYYPKFADYAQAAGVEGAADSKTSDRFGASIDSYQAGLYGVGEALGSDWMGEQRKRNDLEARNSQQLASMKGAVDRWADVHGVGDGLDYVGGLGIQALPYLAEAAVGGFVGRGLTTSARIAGGVARDLGMEAVERQALAQATKDASKASVAGAVAASYPSSMGDILQNQRDQNGTTDALAAGLLAVPYAGLNALDPSHLAAAKLTGFRNPLQMLDRDGVRWGAARMAAAGGKAGLLEGANEAGQEGFNQLGRMAVDPTQAFYDDSVDEQGNPTARNSADRFKEAFVGGALLGGAMGGGLGGWRRSEAWHQKQAADEQARVEGDLLARINAANQARLQAQAAADAQARKEQDLLQAYVPKRGDQIALLGSPDAAPIDNSDYVAPRPDMESVGPLRGQGEFDFSPPSAGISPAGLVDATLLDSTPMEDRRGLRSQITALDTLPRARLSLAPQESTEQNPAAAVGAYVDALPEQDLSSIYEIAAAKADQGQPLSLVEQHVLTTRNTAPARVAAQPLDLSALSSQSQRVMSEPQQGDMFPLDRAERRALLTSNNSPGLAAPEQEATPARDELTRDWVSEPGEFRSQMTQRTQQQPSAFTVKTSIEIAPLVHDTAATTQYLDAAQAKLDAELAKLDKKVSGDSNTLTPQEYAQKRSVLEAKMNDLIAARDVADQYTRASVQRMAERGLERARPGVSVGEELRPDNAASVEAAMGPTMQAAGEQTRQATAAVDARVQQRASDDTASQRESVIREALSQPYTGNPRTAARNALKAAGFTAFNPNAKEVELVKALHAENQAAAKTQQTKRADVAAAVKQPPSLAYANGNFTPRSDLEGEANGTETLEAVQAEAQGQQAPSVPVAAAAGQVTQVAPDASTAATPRTDTGASRTAGSPVAQRSVADSGRVNDPNGPGNKVSAGVAADVGPVATDANGAPRVNRALKEAPKDERKQASLETVQGLARDYRAASIDAAEATARGSTIEARKHAQKLRSLADHIQAFALDKAEHPEVNAAAQTLLDEEVETKDLTDPKAVRFRTGTPNDKVGADTALTEKLRGSKNLAQALRVVMATATNQADRALARALLALKGMEQIGFVQTADSLTNPYGFYDPAQRAVTLMGSADAQTLLHEAVHAGTMAALYNGHINPSTGKPISALGRELVALFEKTRQRSNGEYGFTNVDEFLAEAMTNPKFQEALRNDSVWDKFVQWVGKLLGIPKMAMNSLDKTLAISKQLMSENDAALAREDAAQRRGKPARSERLNQTDTPEFRRWFGGSKVVDAEGKPLVMYHSTAVAGLDGAGIAVFEPGAADAIFVTPDRSFASTFRQGDGANVIPLFVKSENPFDYEDPTHLAALRSKLDELYDSKGKPVPDSERALRSVGVSDSAWPIWQVLSNADPERVWQVMEAEGVQAAIRALGHDGFYVLEKGVKNLAVYKPTQIKSAIGNNGQFDPANPDIRYSEGGAPGTTTARDENGQPAYIGRTVELGFAQPVERFEVIPNPGERILNFAVMPKDGFDVLGYVELLMGADGKPKSLLDIEVNDKAGGTGRAVIETILGANPQADLNISNIVQTARGFWERMGVPQQNLEDGAAYDGTLNWNTYAQARDGRPTRRATQAAYGASAGPRSRTDTAAESQARGLASEGVQTGSGLRGKAYSAGGAANEFRLPEPRRFSRGEHTLKSVLSALSDWRNMPGSLGFLTRRQLADRFQSIKAMRAYDAAESAREVMQNTWVNLTHKQAALWHKLPEKVGVDLGRAMLESSYWKVHADLPFDHKDNAHLRVGEPDVVAANRAKHAEIAKMLEALGQASPTARKLYADVKEDMQRQWDEMAQIKLDSIIDAYPELDFLGREMLRRLVTSPTKELAAVQAQLKQDKHTPATRRALNKLVQDSQEHLTQVGALQGPYFPFVRFGDHVVVLKSKSYAAAQEKLKEASEALQKVLNEEIPGDEKAAEAFDARLKEARKQVQQARSVVADLKDNDQHYSVTFFEKNWEAQQYLNDLNSKIASSSTPDTLEASIQTRAQYVQTVDGVSGSFVNKIAENLRRHLPASQHAAIDAAVRDLYLSSLPDRSAMKAEMRRMNVRGVRADEMIRGYAARSTGNAFRAARMKYGKQISGAVEELRGSENRDEILLGDEIAKRVALGIVTPERNLFTAFTSTAAQVSHLWHLGMSPAYWLMNASQPWVISAPIMGARHGMGRTAAALSTATKEVAGVVNLLRKELKEELKGDKLASWKSMQIDIDPERLGKTDGEKAMLRELFNGGLLAINVKHDLATIAAGEEAGWVAKAAELASAPANVIEAVNRVATALAAYRLQHGKGSAKAEQQAHADAVAYASQVVADTHFDYSEDNAPRLMRAASLGGLGRLLFQFKKYTQAIIYLQAKLFSDAKVHKLFATDSADDSAKEARKAFAYLNGVTLAAAGGAGLLTAPAVAIVAKAIQAMYPDDDEPDLGQMVYNGLSDVSPTLARTAFYGAPAALGTNLSSTLGMGTALNPFAFANTDKEGRDLFASLMLSAAGPAVSLAANWFEAAKVSGQNPMKAAELAAPRAIRNLLQAGNRQFVSDDPTTVQQEGGVSTRSGLSVVRSDELSTWDNLVKAVGFESTMVGERYERKAAQLNKEKALGDVRKSLIGSWNPKDGITEDIQAFNQRNPNARINYQDLLKSHRERVRAQRETVNGVRPNKRITPDVQDQLAF